MQNRLVATLVSSEGYNTGSWTDRRGVPKDGRLCNTNNLVRDGTICGVDSDAFPGAYGVKTGTTRLAGHCLVSAAHRTIGNKRRDVFVVVSGSASDDDRYEDSSRLLKYGLNLASAH